MFQTKKFLTDHFGSVQGVIAFLGAYGAPLPKTAAVEKWFQRESIPSEWLPVLLSYLEIDKGRPIGLAPYLGGGSHAN